MFSRVVFCIKRVFSIGDEDYNNFFCIWKRVQNLIDSLENNHEIGTTASFDLLDCLSVLLWVVSQCLFNNRIVLDCVEAFVWSLFILEESFTDLK